MNPTGVERPALRAALETLGSGAVTVVEVGSGGAADSWYRIEPLTRWIGFEPDPAECQRLNASCDTQHERFYPVALGKVNGPGPSIIGREPERASLFPSSEFLPTVAAPIRAITVSTMRLDSWAHHARIGRLDFLRLATQGAEVDILQGAGELLDGCLGIEIVVTPDRDGQTNFADVDTYIRGRGFSFCRFDRITHFSGCPSDRTIESATDFLETVHDRSAAGDGRILYRSATYFRDRTQIAGPRSLLTLATLLEASGDGESSRSCLEAVGHARTTIFSPPIQSRPPREEAIAALDLDAAAKKLIAIRVGCDDSLGIPKVPGAGSVVVENGERLQILHNGLKIVEGSYRGPRMAAIIELLDGHHEPQHERAFHELLRHLKPGSTMLELGSFWAYYSMWFAKALPGGRIVMVEPDPGNLELGKRNLALNGLTGEFLQGCIGRKATPPRPFFCKSDSRQHSVAQLCVDGILRDANLPRVDLLVADIRGAELEMLHGAMESLKEGRIRFLVVSTHHYSISADPALHQKCVEFLRTHGGHVLLDLPVAESFSGDGLIVASFAPADRNLPPIRVSRNWPSNSLFRDLEYDFAEAYEALIEAGKELEVFGQRNQALGAMLNRLRAKHVILTKKWPAFG